MCHAGPISWCAPCWRPAWWPASADRGPRFFPSRSYWICSGPTRPRGAPSPTLKPMARSRCRKSGFMMAGRGWSSIKRGSNLAASRGRWTRSFGTTGRSPGQALKRRLPTSRPGPSSGERGHRQRTETHGLRLLGRLVHPVQAAQSRTAPVARAPTAGPGATDRSRSRLDQEQGAERRQDQALPKRA